MAWLVKYLFPGTHVKRLGALEGAYKPRVGTGRTAGAGGQLVHPNQQGPDSMRHPVSKANVEGN